MKKLVNKSLCALMVILSLSLLSMHALSAAPIGDRLSEQQVGQRVAEHLKQYEHSDIQMVGRGIHVGTELLPLHDLQDIVIAYMVPLYDSASEEVGYIISSAYDAGSVMCELHLDAATVSDYTKFANKNGPLLYIGLGQYAAQNKAGDTYSVIDARMSDATRSTVDALLPQNEESMATITADSLDTGRISQFTLSVKGVGLDSAAQIDGTYANPINYDAVDIRFYNICTGYYGGNQDWLDFPVDQTTCGQVCAANIFAYEAMYNGKSGLYLPSTHSQADYLSHMNDVVSYFGPLPVANTTIMSSSFRSFTQYRGYKFDLLENIYGETAAGYRYYIQLALAGNHPLAYLQRSGYYSKFNDHWMAVTRYYANTAGQEWISVSTWGRRETFDLNLLFSGMSGGGFCYFVPAL